jgi:hypothetical protein
MLTFTQDDIVRAGESAVDAVDLIQSILHDAGIDQPAIALAQADAGVEADEGAEIVSRALRAAGLLVFDEFARVNSSFDVDFDGTMYCVSVTDAGVISAAPLTGREPLSAAETDALTRGEHRSHRPLTSPFRFPRLHPPYRP